MNRAYRTIIDEEIHIHNQPAVQPTKKVVVKVRRKSVLTKGEKIIYGFLSFLFILTCLFIVSYASKVDMLNREVQQLEINVREQQIENQTLYYELSELSSPERITSIAKLHGLKIQDTKVKQAVTVGE